MLSRVDPIHSFRLLIQACIGAIIGVLFAMLLAGLLFPLGDHLLMPDAILPLNTDSVLLKPREKGFYLLSLLLGFLGAYFTTPRLWALRPLPLLLGLIVSVPLTNTLARQILQRDHSFLALFLLLVIAVLFAIIANRKGQSLVLVGESRASDRFRWKLYLLFLAVITALLLPASFTEVAAHIGMQLHVASFLIAPALYALGDHLLPGIDFFTQYSVGMGWLFSYVLGSTAEQTILNYTYVVIIAMWAFYAQILYLLFWLYRSWVPAAFIGLLSLILLFHTTFHFFDPSSSVLRYPLMGICALLLARLIEQPNSVRQLLLAAAIALSIFLNTETGIIIAIAVTLACLLTTRCLRPMLWQLMRIGLASFSFFLFLLLVVFGPHILQADFLRYLVEPFLIYGKYGYGGCTNSWNLIDLNWFYNLVAPGITIATLGVIARSARSAEADQPRLAVLAFFAISGMLMLVKYTNSSLIAIWQMNALGLLVCIGWWVNVLAKRYNKSRWKLFILRGPRIHGSFVVWTMAMLAAIKIAAFSNDVRNPSEYGLRSWVLYPSLVKSFFWKQERCANFDCFIYGRPAAKDVALIQERTKPGEQVAIIDLYDWTYLVSAHRPPVLFFLPSAMMFTKRMIVESVDRIKKAPYLFLPKGASKEEPNLVHGDINGAFLPTFHDHYVFDGEGERLVAWRRKV